MPSWDPDAEVEWSRRADGVGKSIAEWIIRLTGNFHVNTRWQCRLNFARTEQSMCKTIISNTNKRGSQKFWISLRMVDSTAWIIWFQPVCHSPSVNIPKWRFIQILSSRLVWLCYVLVCPPVWCQCHRQSIERSEFCTIGERGIAKGLVEIAEGVHCFNCGAEFRAPIGT